MTHGTHCHVSPGLRHSSPQGRSLLVAAHATSLPANFVGHHAPPDPPHCITVLASEAKADVQSRTLTKSLGGASAGVYTRHETLKSPCALALSAHAVRTPHLRHRGIMPYEAQDWVGLWTVLSQVFI